MTDIGLVNINGHIVAFCKTQDFKTYVRSAINDEMFWRDLFQKYNVQSAVRDELNNILPGKVKSEADKIVRKQVKEQLDNYTQFQIPCHVAKGLSEQITGFLNNNVQMNQIVVQHSQELNQQLYDNASQILSKVVNEEQYHEVTNLHISVMKQKYDNKLKSIEDSAQRQLNRQDLYFGQKLTSIENQVNEKLSLINLVNTKIDKTYTELLVRDIEIKELEDNVSFIKNVLLGVLTTFSIGTICYLIARRY